MRVAARVTRVTAVRPQRSKPSVPCSRLRPAYRKSHFGAHAVGDDFAEPQLRLRTKRQLQALAQGGQTRAESAAGGLQADSGVSDAGKTTRGFQSHLDRDAAARFARIDAVTYRIFHQGQQCHGRTFKTEYALVGFDCELEAVRHAHVHHVEV